MPQKENLTSISQHPCGKPSPSPEHRLRKPPLEHPRHQHIDAESGDEAHDGIYQVMRLDVDRGSTQQQVERQEAGEQLPAAAPRHNHQDGGHADVRAGESCRGTLAHLLGTLHQVVEEAVLVARTGKQLLVVVEVIADGRENALRHTVGTDSREVELRTGNGDEYIYKVIDEESGDDDERHLLEEVETVEEVPHHHYQNHGVIEEVAHVERLADPHLRETFAEPDGRLSAEEPLLCRGEHVVEVGEDAVELESVGIPIGEQRHVDGDAHKGGELAGRQPIEVHQQEGHACNQHPVCQHTHRVVHLLKKKQNQDRGQQVVYQRHLLYRKQPLAGFYPLE